MAYNVYISPSMQTGNKYSAGNTTEEIECNRIADELEREFQRCGITYLRGASSGTLAARCAESNLNKCKIHLSLHTNATNFNNTSGTAKGVELYFYKTSLVSKAACQDVYNELVAVMGNGRGLKSSSMVNFYEPNNTNGITVYVEAGFHDYPVEAQWIINNPRTIAVAICKGLCKNLGKEYIKLNPPIGGDRFDMFTAELQELIKKYK